MQMPSSPIRRNRQPSWPDLFRPSTQPSRPNRRVSPGRARDDNRTGSRISRWSAQPMAQEFSPTEIFKRATAATLRAIAERDDVTVSFGPEPAGLSGTRVELPNPPRDLPADEAAQLRGAADSWRLRLRYHDDAVHSRRLPGEPAGARRLRGGRAGAGRGAGRAAHGRRRRQSRRDARRAISPPGLRADHRAQRGHDGRGGAPADPRGADRSAPPPSARQVVDLWRPWLEAKIARDLGELDRAILDQDAYARATRRMIQDLDIDLGEAEDSESDEQQEGEEAEGENQSEGEGATTGAQPSLDGSPADGEAEDAQDAAEAGDGEMMPGSSDDDPGRPGRPGMMPRGAARRHRDLPRLHHRLRRGRRGRRAVRRRRADAAAPPARPAARASAERHRAASPTGCSAASWPSRPAPGSSTSTRACSTPRGCRASSPTRSCRLPTSASRRPISATRW